MITQATYNQFLSAVSLVLTVYTVYLAHAIYKYNRFSKGWLFIIAGFSMAVVRRGVVYLNAAIENAETSTKLVLLESHLAILSIIMFVFGFWWIRNDFAGFKAIAIETETKLKRFMAPKKRGRTPRKKR